MVLKLKLSIYLNCFGGAYMVIINKQRLHPKDTYTILNKEATVAYNN